MGVIIIIATLFANRESVIYLRDLPSAQAEQGDGRAQCRAGKLLAQEVGAAARIEAVKWLDLCIRDPAYEGDDEAR